MPLHHLLFRCPDCGNDPTAGERDVASCPACGATFSRLRKGGEVEVEREGGQVEEARIEDLLEKIEAFGGALASDTGPDGRITRSASVIMQVSGGEEALHFRGSVLGFVENLSHGQAGLLRLEDDRLVFEVAGPEGVNGEESAATAEGISWDLLDIRAVQSASTAVQISPAGGGVVQFKFESDSPFRWEALLKGALQKVYSSAGRGVISEFQPRIVSG